MVLRTRSDCADGRFHGAPGRAGKRRRSAASAVLAGICAALLTLTSYPAIATGGGSKHGGSSHSSKPHASTPRAPQSSSSGAKSRSHASPGVKRDKHGRIARSEESKDEFKKSHPCPSTGKSSGACPGYVIDHVVPLKRGGADAPSNMQWQTTRAAKAKDKVE